jgi:GT2 family glycosyltransferase
VQRGLSATLRPDSDIRWRCVEVAAPEVLVVSYGQDDGPTELLASLRAQTLAPARILVWHNGPTFPPRPIAGVEQHWSGVGVGYGEGINQLLARTRAAKTLIATDDVVLDKECLARIAEEMEEHPRAVAVGCALVGSSGLVNAYGLRLTADWVGVNTDRGRPWAEFARDAPRGAAPYLGPSGALFALNREEWERVAGGPIFPRSFFLYMEDVIFGVRLRLLRAEVRFRPDAFASHAWSVATGKRSAEKLRLVERNRLWMLRAARGRIGATRCLPWTALRYASYLRERASAPRSGSAPKAFWRAMSEGLFGDLPADVRDYLREVAGRPLPRWCFASFREQLRNPVS